MPVVEINCMQTQRRVKTSGFRCRIQTNSTCMNNTSQLNHKRSCPIADMYAPKSMGPGDRMLPSRNENVTNCQSLSQTEYSRDVRNHGNKLLIHHQRHSLKNRFHLLRTLGEGTYGKVKLAADKGTGEHVAIKYIRKTKIQDENDRARIRREIRILSSLKHKHVVSIREVFEKKDKIVLVMDYVPGGELYDYLDKMSPLSERESRRIFRQLVSAVHYCHENGIVHRDLKLENIILDEEGNVKMADFGLSNYYSQTTKLSTFCGSPLYASPEIVNGQPYHGPEVDVWSLGVILYTLVYGAMPFESANLVLLKRQISTGNYSQPCPPSDSAGLIRHMLTVTPSRRANLDDILHHWWVNLGYPNMPNDMPYNPEQAPTVRTARRDSVESSGNAHDSCNSSISSDSDAEIDLQTLNCFTMHINKCNTASCPSDGPSHYRRTHDLKNYEDSSVTLSTPPIFSPDVSEISKGCRTALISSNNNSSTFNDTTSVSMKSEDFSSTDDCAQASPSTFDSEKKPAKGILKRKGKFSGGDSGCVMPEDMATKIEDIHSHEFDDLSRDLDSLTVSSSDVFDENEQGSCYPIEINPHCVQSKTFDSSVSQVDWSINLSQSPKKSQQNQQQFSHQSRGSTNSKAYNIVRNLFNGTVPGDATTANSHLPTPAITRHESISRL